MSYSKFHLRRWGCGGKPPVPHPRENRYMKKGDRIKAIASECEELRVMGSRYL
jgi:hypothetical protein